MWWPASCILVLAISEPLLVYAAKVVVVVPQQIRRSPVPLWRSGVQRYRKSSQGSEYHHKYHGPPGHYHFKKPLYANPPFPHGGDDFDQGHENVNHVHIPHGKEISSAISFGKGYIPYDQIKGSFSLGGERHSGSQEYEQSEPVYASTSFSPVGSEYPPSGHSYESSHVETYFADPESAMSYNERRNDRKKFYSARSIDKDLTANSQINLSAALDQGKEQLLLLQQKAADLYRTMSLQPHHQQEVQGNVILPAGIPSATIGGSKEGIVLRDSVSLDEYQQKLQEMTKTWPQFAVNGGNPLIGGYQNQQLTASFPAAGQLTSSYTGSIEWPLNIAQSKQGYAVKEDTMEPPRDLRAMPIHINPFQAFSQTTNVVHPSLTQIVHG